MKRCASTLKKSTRTRYEEYSRRKNGSQDYDKVLRELRHLNDLRFLCNSASNILLKVFSAAPTRPRCESAK